MKERESDLKWFPFWIDKWLFGSMRIEHTRAEMMTWIDLLALAGKDNGYIRANEEMGYPIKSLAGILQMDADELDDHLKSLVKSGKLEQQKTGVLKIITYEKYQLSERHKRRFKQGENAPMSGKTDIVSGKQDPIREDKRIEDKRIEDIGLAPIERKILNELKKVKNYPYNFTDTIEYIRELAVEFPDIDILDEIQKKVAWWRDNPLTKKSNPHLQLRNWFKNAVKFNAERKVNHGVGGRSDNEKVMARFKKQRLAGDFDDLDKED